MNFEEALKSSKTMIVDVRTPLEFSGGHVAGSVNIPLNEIPDQEEFLKSKNAPLVFCCASGMRSGQAEEYLRSRGFQQVFNGGPWTQVNYLLNN